MMALGEPAEAEDIHPPRSSSQIGVGAGISADRVHVPDFFIVGQIKSGTTALYKMLRQHPKLYMPVKEPRFFAPELRSRFQRLGFGNLPDTLEDYLSLFRGARPDQLVGEASPQYLMSLTAAQRIADVAPEARIVAILREPASFLRSLHLQLVHGHIETQKDFRKALALEDARRRGKRIPPFSQSPAFLIYSDHIRYVEQLRRFHDRFSRERTLVLIYEDFRRDNEATVRRVLRFLNVDEEARLETVESRRLEDIRSVLLHQLNGMVSVARGHASRFVPSIAYEGRDSQFEAVRRRLVYKPRSSPDDALMLDLRRRFKPEVVALSEYLERDLVGLWGYDEIN